jgi:hypothetical protein
MSENPGKPINQVVAENLKYWMAEAGFETQQALAVKSGVSQRTIGNYLNPGLRDDTNSGKEPSAKVTELAKLAAALGIGVWQLLRSMSPQERAFYAQIEAAYEGLTVVKPAVAPDAQDSGFSDFGEVYTRTTKKKTPPLLPAAKNSAPRKRKH